MSSKGADSRPRADLIHQQLNPDRTILPGEWLELAALHDQHGSELLIWQARAQRAGRTRVTPDYYRACAAQDALATYRPRRSRHVDRMATTDGAADGPPVTALAPAPVVVPDQGSAAAPRGDTARRALLDQLGQAAGEPVRCPHLLDQVAPALLIAWTRVVGHAGLRARFADPLGFAIRQLQQGHVPPPHARLDAWARSASPPATPWTVDDVVRLNREYGDLFRLGSGRSLGTTADPRPPTDSGVHVGPWTAAEVARLNQAYGDLFRLGSGRDASPVHVSSMRADSRPRRSGRDSGRMPQQVWSVTKSSLQGTTPATDSVLAQQLMAELRLRAGRGPLRTLLDQVTLTLQDGTVQIQCRGGTQVALVYTHLVPLLPTVLAELGIQARVVVGIQR